MNKKIDLELAGLSNDELLELYNIVEEHRAYLEKSIINIEEETEEKEEEKKNESTK